MTIVRARSVGRGGKADYPVGHNIASPGGGRWITKGRGVSRNPGRGVLTRMLSMSGVWSCMQLASWAEFAKVGLCPTI